MRMRLHYHEPIGVPAPIDEYNVHGAPNDLFAKYRLQS